MRFIRDVLLKNWSLKLTAILMAFTLWLVVRGNPSVERVVSVPLTVQIPRNMEITNERPASVEVTVRGPFSNMAGSQPNFSYVINLQSASEGEHTITLSPYDVRVSPPSGITVMKVSPARVNLILEQTLVKEVPVVVPPLRGQPASGYDVYSVTLSPEQVRVSGPRSQVEPIQNLPTDSISVAGQNQPFRAFPNLEIMDNDLHVTPSGPVEVDVQIGPHRVLHSVTLDKISVQPEESGFTAVTPALTLQVLVPVTFKGKLTPADFAAAVSVANLDPETAEARLKPEVTITADLDPDIVIKQVRPAEVLVRKVKGK